MTIVEAARGVTGGVDTHLDVHVAAALDPLGALLGSEPFETTAASYRELLRIEPVESVDFSRTRVRSGRSATRASPA